MVERAMTPDSQSGSCGFEPRRGYRPIRKDCGRRVTFSSPCPTPGRGRSSSRETPAPTRFPEPRSASVTPTSLCPTPGRGSTSRDDFGPFFTSACRGDWPPRRLWAPEIAGSTPAGQTKALACDADQRLCRLCRRGRPLRRRGEAVPASLMSSRPWVRIPPALLHSGT